MGTTDNPAPVMMKVYSVCSAYWDSGYVVDHYDNAIEVVRDLLEGTLDHHGKETVTITTEDMDEEKYRALPEFEGF